MNTNTTQAKLYKIYMICLFIGFFLILCLLFSQKKNLHTDDVTTFILANNSYNNKAVIYPEDGVTYTPADSLWMNEMTVKEGHQFDYKRVFELQTLDVHPPLHMLLVHTISSFFPGQFHMMYAGCINILFMMLSLLFFYKLTKLFINNPYFILLSCTWFCLSAGILSASTYLRMYVIAMFDILLLTYLFLKVMNKKIHSEPVLIRDYLFLFLAAILGAMTQYYVIFYIVMLTCVLDLFLLVKKSYKDFFCLCASMILAGGCFLLIFPTAISHLTENTSEDSAYFANTHSSIPEYLGRVRDCFAIINGQVFSGLLLAIGVLTMFLIVLALTLGKKRLSESKVWTVLLLSLPSLFYFLAVTRVCRYITDRYFHPIYAISILLVAGLLFWATTWIPKRLPVCIILSLLVLFTIGKDWKGNLYYLSRSTTSMLEEAKNYADKDCIFIYRFTYEINPSFYEVSNYKSVTFYQAGNLEKLKEWNHPVDQGIVLVYPNELDVTYIKTQVENYLGSFSSETPIGTYSFNSSVYLH